MRLALMRLVLVLGHRPAASATEAEADSFRWVHSPGQASSLAADLARLMDVVESEEVDLSLLGEVAPEEFAGHWQITVEFLKIVTEYWPQYLSDNRLVSPVARRNMLMALEAERLAKGSPYPVIAAGSTGKVPATAFLSSYLMGLRYPHEWDVFFYSKDGLKMAREIFAKQNIMYVGRIHHGPNIIHSKKPIRSIEDFKDLKLRVPGGMIAEGFAAIGAKTTLLPGGEVFSALEKGTIEAADYTGPAVNWDLGFQQVTKYIWMGPVGLESIYQPVDLMDFCVGMNHWNKLSPKMKAWVELEIEAYSSLHHAAIQKADMEAWPKFIKAGTEINRLPVSDLEKFQRVAVPIWFKWANKDKDAAHIFKLQLDVMESPTFGYVEPEMYKGLKIEL
jgi:hypothetical protein